MPKKEEPKEISEDESELEEAVEEDELEEIAEKVSDEDSTGETIDDNQFREFLKPSESFSPVLERVETPGQELLEQDVASTPTDTERGEGVNYATTSNEPEYSATRTEREEERRDYAPPVLTPRISSDDSPRQVLLDPSSGKGINPQNNDTQPRRVEREFREETKRLPFEKRYEEKGRKVRL